MPVLNEAIPNRALSGSEIKSLILEDCQRMVTAESLLSDHLAYGRISYRITLTMNIDNQFIPQSNSYVDSKPVGTNLLGAMPEMNALESFPLKPPSEVVGSVAVTREISSPNSERLRAGLPVPADVMLPDGTYATKHIQYPATGEDGNVKVEDATDEARAKLGLPPRK